MSRPLAPEEPAATVPRSVDEVIAMVRDRGGRATATRRILLEVIFEADDHITAEELASSVQRRAPDVHLSTVYRNLDELQRLGVVVHSHLGHGPATYQLASQAHAHFICEQCGRTLEAPDSLFAGLAEQMQRQHGFTIDPHHFAILGRCAECSSSGARPGS